MNQSDNISELATALSKAQSEIQGAKKDSSNPYFKSRYADLASCWEAAREAATKNGLSVWQGGVDSDKGIVLETKLLHSSGQWIVSKMLMPNIIYDKNSPSGRPMNSQEIGATITYFRRFALCAVLGICPEDDDGNSVSQSARNEQKQPVPHVNNEQKITPDQAIALKKMLSQCSPDIANSLLASLRAAPIHANTIEQIPAVQYDPIAKYIMGKIQVDGAKNE